MKSIISTTWRRILITSTILVVISSQELNSTSIISPADESLIPIPSQNQDSQLPSFWSSFWAGFWLILVSEIGDKTFFLTMIYAATNSVTKTLILSSIVMLFQNYLSLVIGYAIPFFLFRNVLDILAILIFTGFGIKLIYDGLSQESVLIEKELEEIREEYNTNLTSQSEDVENTKGQLKVPLINNKNNLNGFTQSAWAYAGTLLVAECGDRSQITAIVIAAVNDFYGVLLGTSVAHVLTIILAIFSGNMLSHMLTNRQLMISGGVMFIIFALAFVIEKLAFL